MRLRGRWLTRPAGRAESNLAFSSRLWNVRWRHPSPDLARHRMPRKHLSFQPDQRMHTPAEYESVFAQKHSAGDAVLLVFVALREEGPARLGTSVGKRLGNSVVRHAWKRAIREAFRTLQYEIKFSGDLVVVPRPGATPTAAEVMAWYNARAGKTQRLSALRFIDELPRSAIGKVLKRELRDTFDAFQ